MTDAAHVACAHFGHSRDRWPPGKAETSAAAEAEEEAKEQEEARKAAEAEVERLGTRTAPLLRLGGLGCVALVQNGARTDRDGCAGREGDVAHEAEA